MNATAQAVRLVRCQDCGRLDSPGRIVCAGCLSARLQEHPVPGEGTIATYTTIRRAPSKFRDEAPYDIVVVDLDCGVRVTGRLQRESAPAAMGARAHATGGDATGLVFAVEA
jgi:uncharacterized OB-fold protein